MTGNMDFSLPAWIGALIGTIIAVAIYVPGIRVFERQQRTQSGPMTLEQRKAFEDKLSVMRRLILGADIAILAVAGYWLGTALSGMRG
jgi:tetrahydromethanopterin S-methyltransferase subunit C